MLKSIFSSSLYITVVLPFIVVVVLLVAFFFGGSFLESVPDNRWLQDNGPYLIFLSPLVVALLVFVALFYSSWKKEKDLNNLKLNDLGNVSGTSMPIKAKSIHKDVFLPALVAFPGLFGVSLVFNILSIMSGFRDASRSNVGQGPVILSQKFGIFTPNFAGVLVCGILVLYAYRSYKEIKSGRIVTDTDIPMS